MLLYNACGCSSRIANHLQFNVASLFHLCKKSIEFIQQAKMGSSAHLELDGKNEVAATGLRIGTSLPDISAF